MSMTTTAASVAPLAAAAAVPLKALYAAAAPATPLLVGSGISNSQKNTRLNCFKAGCEQLVRLCLISGVNYRAFCHAGHLHQISSRFDAHHARHLSPGLPHPKCKMRSLLTSTGLDINTRRLLQDGMPVSRTACHTNRISD